jgi:hypothetical protein
MCLFPLYICRRRAIRINNRIELFRITGIFDIPLQHYLKYRIARFSCNPMTYQLIIGL